MALATPTVYIPTLEGGERLADCLTALESQTAVANVVVVDNGTGEGCSGLLSSRFPNAVRIGFGGQNLGFGTSLNRAVAAEGSGPVIFLNDDAKPEPAFVENLLAAWNQGETVMVAGVLLRADQPERIDSAGISCDRTLTGWDYLTGEPATALVTAADPFGPTGGGALFDRAAFEEVGGFDENLFLYYEDLDLALRMRLAGHECRLAKEAVAFHEGSATIGKRAARKYHFTGYGRGYLLRKYRIMSHPVLAIKVLLSDASAAVAQLLLDRTLAGVKGKVQGWRAAAGTEPLEPPFGQLEPASLRRHFQVRLARRGS